MKITLIIVLLIQLSHVYAGNTFLCPSVTDIKKSQFNFWLPLYVANEELASDRDMADFKKNVTQLTHAKWSKMYLEYARCVYAGNSSITSKIILARDAWRPLEGPFWIWTTPKVTAECYPSSPENCPFIQ